MKESKKDMILHDTATFDMAEVEMRETNAMSIIHHLIKHDYTVTELNRFHDSLSDQWTIRAKKPIIIFPESPKIKVDDLIKIFSNAVEEFRKNGKVNIEIDQGCGALDISVTTSKPKE